MKKHNQLFKQYLDNVSRRQPSPGGGSVTCLMFCQGVSLLEKALNYSCTLNDKTQAAKNKNKKIKKYVASLYSLRKKIYPFINKDGEIFEKVMNSKGQKRKLYIKRSEELIVEVAKACIAVFSLAKRCESDIKKSIISDFRIGKECVKIALKGSIMNLKANTELFNSKNKSLASLQKELKKWQ
jgi:methenyltetrahydrofolate cyclohydrolase